MRTRSASVSVAALGSPSMFRTRYRDLLDTAGLDGRQVVDEAVHAFELNIAVLELAGLPVAA